MMWFGAAAVALAAVGVYGVIAYGAAQRRGEVATRLALGATPGNVFWLVLKQGRTLALVGAAIGVTVAYLSGRIVSSRLYDVQASDPVVLIGATALRPRDGPPRDDGSGDPGVPAETVGGPAAGVRSTLPDIQRAVARAQPQRGPAFAEIRIDVAPDAAAHGDRTIDVERAIACARAEMR